jgi:hypothetical protein
MTYLYQESSSVCCCSAAIAFSEAVPEFSRNQHAASLVEMLRQRFFREISAHKRFGCFFPATS